MHKVICLIFLLLKVFLMLENQVKKNYIFNIIDLNSFSI